jgi:hypothetical protein
VIRFVTADVVAARRDHLLLSELLLAKTVCQIKSEQTTTPPPHRRSQSQAPHPIRMTGMSGKRSRIKKATGVAGDAKVIAKTKIAATRLASR